MIFDNYVWSGDALWIAIETITPVLIESGADLEYCGGHPGQLR